MSELIHAQEMTKTIGYWKPETIVDHVSFSLQSGEIMGLLGPNGAGKTTTMKMLLGLTSITSGTASMFNVPVPSPASRVGVGFLPEMVHHPDHLSVLEYVLFHAHLGGIADGESAMEEHLRRVHMWEFRDRLLADCSKGMRQRTDIARLLLRQARLIFLDEPFSGLDPCGQVMLKDLLISLKSQQISVLVNSHAAGTLADVCDRVSIMNRGRLILSDRLEKLLYTPLVRLIATFPNSQTTLSFTASQSTASTLTKEPNTIEVVLKNPSEVNGMIQAALKAGGSIREVAPVALSLDQLFVQVIADKNPDGKGEAE